MGALAAAPQLGQNFAPPEIGCPQLLHRVKGLTEGAAARADPECITKAVIASMLRATTNPSPTSGAKTKIRNTHP